MACNLKVEVQDIDRSDNSPQTPTISEICEGLSTLTMSRQEAMIDLKQEDPSSIPLSDTSEPSNHLRVRQDSCKKESTCSVGSVDSGRGPSPRVSGAHLSLQTTAIEGLDHGIFDGDVSDILSACRCDTLASPNSSSDNSSSSSIDGDGPYNGILQNEVEQCGQGTMLEPTTRADPALKLPKNAEEVFKDAVKSHADDFCKSTEWRMLLAHLVKRDLVDSDDCSFLNSDRSPLTKSNDFYFTTLTTKGPTAYRKLYLALREEKTHAGHVHLVKIMTHHMNLNKN